MILLGFFLSPQWYDEWGLIGIVGTASCVRNSTKTATDNNISECSAAEYSWGSANTGFIAFFSTSGD